MQVRFSTVLIGLLVLAGAQTAKANANVAADIARIHVEAIGGVDRINRLESLRAGGETVASGQEMDFQMWARRPNAVRIEVEAQGLYMVQGWSGEGEPWIQAGAEGERRAMPPALASAFKLESEFDDPLVNPEERGYVLDYAGEDEVGERPVVKLIATRSASDQSVLYIAADTYFIVRQDRVQLRPDGSKSETQTFYGDFRPVQGVILPHKVVVWAGEELVSETMMNWMEGNPPLEKGMFAAEG
ncbi:hypothetical protein [Actomonas aquatica]|uniref:MucB/RseB N-terminal domain-containing protein n=1 Tax=Actomonas aquatica TaxID=2866162 RepID=A0ABZ1CBK2_9BACT|nr:hypothetical protein [Opitutus sp. WL0086]WRQ88802.1 hypothetical protein K1X11_005255 [Opitutus sp. WL0086]